VALIQTILNDRIMKWDTPERSSLVRYQKVQKEEDKFGKMGGPSGEWVSMTALVITTQQGAIDDN
jgi:hypothetical protein